MNTVILVGRLVETPVLRHTEGEGIAFTGLKLAVDKPLNAEQKIATRANGGDTAQFFDCLAWRSDAEYVTKYHKKGDTIVIRGSLQYRDKVANFQVQGEATGSLAAVKVRNYSINVEKIEGAGAQLSDVRGTTAQSAPSGRSAPTGRTSTEPAVAPARAASRQAVLELNEDIFEDE